MSNASEVGNQEAALVETDDGAVASMQLIQAVYNELTGKTEKLEKNYDTPFRVVLEDFSQLKFKVDQLCEQYNINQSSCDITVYHKDDSKEVFSSFERFELYNKSSLCPVEQVLLNFNLLIILPQVRKPQSYKLSVRVVSSLVLMGRFRDLHKRMPSEVLMIFEKKTAVVTVEYVDYMVARNLRDCVDEWLQGLDVAELNGFQKFAKQAEQSDVLRSAPKYVLLTVTFYVFWVVAPSFVPDWGGGLRHLFYYSFCAVAVMFLVFRVGIYLGKSAYFFVREIAEVSYIHLNRGDEKLAQAALKRNRESALGLLVSYGAALAIGVLSSVIAYWITSS